MKKILFILMTIFIGVRSYANGSTDAVAQTLVMFGAAKTMGHVTLQGLRAMELPDWQDSKTGVTSEMNAACGVALETRLLGNNRQNYIFLAVRNGSEEEKILRSEDIIFKFSNGRERRALLDDYQHVEIKSGWQYVFILPLPAKSDFKDQTSLNVSFPLNTKNKTCSIEAKLLRNPEAPDRLQSYTRATTMDLVMHLGMAQLNDDNSKLSTSKSTSIFGFDWDFTGINWGGYISYKTIYLTQLNPTLSATESIPSGYQSNVSVGSIGVLYRVLHTESSYFIARFGYGGGSYIFRNGTNNSGSISYSASAMQFALGWRHYFARVDRGFWIGDYSWGVNLQNDYIYSTKMSGGSTVGGNIPSLTLSIGVGI